MINAHRSLCKVSTNYCQILIKLGFSRQIFQKYSNTKYHGRPLSGIRFVTCGRTDRHRQTDMTKVMVAFHNFANAPKNGLLYSR